MADAAAGHSALEDEGGWSGKAVFGDLPRRTAWENSAHLRVTGPPAIPWQRVSLRSSRRRPGRLSAVHEDAGSRARRPRRECSPRRRI
eukprot:252277-Pyramimonas_sp.AAC.1